MTQESNWWGEHYLGGALTLTLNITLGQASLTHNGPAGDSGGVDNSPRPAQKRYRADLNRRGGVAGLSHGVDDIGRGAAAVSGHHCLQAKQLTLVYCEKPCLRLHDYILRLVNTVDELRSHVAVALKLTAACKHDGLLG